MREKRKTRTVLRAAIIVPAALALAATSGCVRTNRSVEVMHQGRSWELVLPTETVSAIRSRAPLESLPEYSRRDAALGVHTPRVPTALDAWPQSHPSIASPRYIYLPRTENRFLFFGTPQEYTPRYDY